MGLIGATSGVRYNHGMASEKITALIVVQAIVANFGPVAVVVVLLVMRDRRWRFSLSLLLLLMTLVAVTAWAWGMMLRHR